MITYKKGNLFDSDADCIFNAVNCEGYMGKGIAYQFKQRFPENNVQYERACKEGRLSPGILLVCSENGKTIINFPTKDRWRNPSQMQYITDGLDEFVRILPELKIRKAAIPPLGCGNGGLNWETVRSEIEDRLRDSAIEVEVFEPAAAGTTTRQDQMTAVDLVLLIAKEHLERPTSLRFQSAFFLANHLGRRQLFAFERGRYGPYSKTLYNEAERIGRYQRENDLKGTQKTFSAIYRTICGRRVDSQYKKMTVAVEKALEVVNHIEDDLLLEGVTTAFYLVRDEHITEKDRIIRAFKAWSEDKAVRFNDDMILHSLDKLESLRLVQRNMFDTYEVLRP